MTSGYEPSFFDRLVSSDITMLVFIAESNLQKFAQESLFNDTWVRRVLRKNGNH